MLALDRSLRRARRGFTLIELVIVLVVVALLSSIGLIGYNALTTDNKRKQAVTLLDGVAAAQQSWYRSRGTFVAFADDASGVDGRATLDAARTQQLLKRIAPGTEDARTEYVPSTTASTRFGQISVKRFLPMGGVPRLILGMLTQTSECMGTIVVPPGSGLASVSPRLVETKNASGTTVPASPCTAQKTQDVLGGGAPSSSTSKPGTPVGVRLTPAPGRILITWQAPASDGSNAPSSYVVTDGAGNELMSVDAAITSYADGTLAPLDPAKSYSYAVIARNGAGDSAPATPTPTTAKPLDPATTAPDRPTGLTATWNAGVQLSWSPSGIDGASAATGYEIRRDGQTIACLGKDICAARGYTGQDLLSLTYQDAYSSGSTVKLGATYRYEIRALNQVAGGTSAWASVEVTTPPGPPTAVTAVPVPGVGDSRCAAPACVALTWVAPTAPAGAGVRPAELTGYRIYRGTTASFTPGGSGSTLVGTVDADVTAFADRSLPGAATYYYKVTATNANKDASTNYGSSPAVSTVTAAPALTAKTGTTAGTVTLTWTVPATKKPIARYNVYRLDEDGTPTQIGMRTDTAFTDSGADLPKGLSPFTGYTYIVAAETADGIGMPSNRASAMAPNAPVRTVTATATTSSVTLRWDRVPGATYVVTRSGTATTYTTGVGRITDTGLAPGTRYTYTVKTRATDPSTGLSSEATSAPFTAVTAPDAPSTLNAAPSGRNVTLTWAPPTASSQVTGYRIMRCLNLPCDANNQPRNPSLETAYTNGTTWWYASRGTGVRTAATSSDGTYALRYTATETMPTPTAAYVLPYAPATGGPNGSKYLVTPGQSLTASMDVRGEDSSPSDGGRFDVGLTWVWYRADGASIASTNAPFTRLDPDTWKTTTLTATAPAGAVAGYPVLYGRRTGGFVPGDSWYVDDARVTAAGVTTTEIAAPATTWTDTNLAADTSYGYAVTALTSGGESAPSGAVTAATIPNPVTASIDTSNPANITVTWTASPVATGYYILRNGVVLTSVPADATSFTDGSRLGGAAYAYVVRAWNDAGYADSNQVSASTTPDPPTGLSANAGATTIALTWLATGADGYQILRCTGASCDATTAPVVATLTAGSPRTWTNTGLAAQTWYGYAVKAGRATTVGGVTTWTWSAASVPTSAKTILDPPTALTVGTVTSSTVALTWTASPGATSYRVYRDGVKLPATPTAASFTDTGLVPGMRYTYTVTAAAANGEESGQSGAVTATTVLPAPTGLVVSNPTTSAVTLAWGAVTGATSYQVMGCALPCSTPTGWGVTASGATTTLTATGLNANASYDLFVIARSSYTTSADSAHVTAWTLPSAPTAPIADPVTATTATLTWTAVPNAVSYTINRDGTPVKTLNAPATSYQDTTLTGGTTYSYTLSVTNPGGSSAPSAATTVLTLPAAPALTATAGYRAAALSWTGSASATSYELWRCPNSGCAPDNGPTGGRLLATLAAATRTSSDTGLADSATYGYAVRAVNTTGPGPFSSTGYVRTTPPRADGPTYTAIGTDRATLTWDAQTNQAANPSFETNTTSWSPVRATLTRDTTVSSDGAASGRLVANVDNAGPTSMYIYPHGTNGVAPIPQGFSVAPGQKVAAQVDVRGDATSPTKAGKFEVSLAWAWYGPDGAGLPGTVFGPVTTLDPAAFQTLTFEATVPTAAPAGAIRALPILYNRTNGGYVVGDALFVDNMRVQMPTDATTFQVFRNGGASPVYTGPATTFTDIGLSAGSTNTYTVAAGNATGYSPVGPASSVTLVPGAVAGLAVATTSSTATLTWTPPAGATGHVITVNGVKVATPGAAGSYTVTGLTPATAYTFTVAATTSGGTGAATSVTGTTRPAAPVSATATPGPGQGAITLTWQAVTGASSYKVLRNGGAPATACVSTAALTCTDTGLADATAYTYTVIAVGAGGDSDTSNPATATTLAAAPTAVTATASGTSATITWTAPAGAVTGYRVWRCTGVSCASTTAIATVATTSFTDSGLAVGTTYRYQVTALTTGGESGKSALTAASSTSTVPGAVTGLVATGANKQAGLTWTAEPVATSYAIYRCAGAACTPTLLTTVTGTSYTDTALAGSSTYSYRVAAANAAGTGVASATVTAVTAPVAPVANPVTVTPTTVTVNWQLPAVAVTGYKVYRSGTLVATIPSGSTTTWTDTGRAPNTAYTYTVSATNASGEGDQSAPINARTSVAVPTGLTSTATTTNSVSLSWTAVTGATGYKVYTNGASPVTVTGGATSATVTGLAPGTQFTFTVTALGTGFESAPSTGTDASTTLGAPVGLAATGGSGQVTLTWTAVPAASGYYLYRCAGTCTPTSAQLLTTLPSSATTSYTDTPVSAGSTYSYTLAAYTPDVTSSMSATVSAVTVPPVPTGLAGTSPSANSITVTWAAAAGATGYKVYTGTAVLYTGTATTATLTGLSAGTTYPLTVTATNASGESAKSAVVNVLTRPAAPTLTLTPGARQVAASWTAATSATSYTLARCAGASCAPVTGVYTGPALTFTSTALADNAVYGFTITATNASGSTTSAIAYATTLSGTPTNLRVTGSTPVSVDLAWDASPGAAGYQLMRGGQLVADLPASETSWTDEGPNVLTNAGFEAVSMAATGITTYNTPTLTRDTAEAHTGQASLRIDTNSSTQTQGYIHFPYTPGMHVAPAGSSTTVSLWVKAAAGTRLAIAGRALNSSGTFLANNVNILPFTATGAWQLVTVPAWTQSQDYVPGLEIRQISAVPGATFWVDDADVANAALDNLLSRNVATAGDGDGTTTGFTAGSAGSTLSIAPAYDIAGAAGKTSLRIQQVATSARTTLVSATRATNPGSVYQFTASVRLADPLVGDPAGSGTLPVNARITWLNEAGTTLSSVASTAVATSNVRYQQVLVPAVTAPAGAVTARLSLELDGASSPSTSDAALYTDGWTLTSDVNPNAAYSYTVAAEASDGTTSAFSSAVTGKTTPQRVDEVVLDLSGAQPLARWGTSTAGTTYRVYTCVAGYGASCTPDWATPTTTTPNAFYYFVTPTPRSQVCVGVSVVATATGNASDAAATLTCDRTAPDAPGNPTRTFVDQTSMTVSWATVAPTAGLTYRVRLIPSTGGIVYACTGTTSASCTVNGLVKGTRYSVSVQATDGANASAWSGSTSIVTTALAPTLAGSLSGGTVTLTWPSAGPDVTYTVSRNGAVLASGLSAQTYSTPLPADGLSYGYTIKVNNGQGYTSSSSNTVSFTSVPPQPGAPTVTENANYTMTATCPAVPSATSYSLWRKDGAAAAVVLTTGPSTSFNDPGPFTGAVTYGYYCQASNSSGSSLVGPGATTKASYATSVVNGDKPDIYYKLNETPLFGANYNYATDSSGNNNHGALAGTLADVDFVPSLARGSAGALGFGTGRYAYAALTGVTTTTPVTTEAWVTFPAATGTSSLMFSVGGTSLWLHPSGTGFGFTTGGGNLFGIPASAVTPLLGKTHHIVAVYGPGPGAMSSSTHKLYIDGVAQSLSLVSAGSGAPAPKIGTTWGISSATAPWQGSYDNVAFYNSELPAAAVAAHYNATNQVAAVAASAPLAHYKLDGAPMADSSGNGRTAGFVGDPDQTNRGGAIGFGTESSVTLAGDVVSLPDLPIGTAPGQSTTVEFITSFAATAENRMVFSFGAPGGTNQYSLYYASTGFGFNTGAGDLYGVPVSAVAGGTHRITASFYDGAVTSSKIWIDGVPQTLSQLAGTAGRTGDVTTDMQLGGWAKDTNYRWVNGVADLAIYNGGMSNAMVQAHQDGGDTGDNAAAVLADNPVAFYRLGDFNVRDYSGWNRLGFLDPQSGANYGTAGALANSTDTGVTWAATSATGGTVTDRMGIRNVSPLAVGSADRTFEMWVKPGNMRLKAAFVEQGSWAYQKSNAFWFGRSSTGGANLAVGDGSVNGTEIPAGALWDGNWHQLHVVVSNAGKTWTVYVDGAQTGSATFATGLTTAPGLLINGMNYAGDSGYTGAPTPMDEFAMYPKALTAAQITAHYNASK